MKVVLLGTTGYHPSDARQTACVMVPELGILFDAGSGAYRLPDYLVGEKLEIFITHAHLDHVIGLTYLFDCLPRQAISQVKVHGEKDKLDAIRDLLFAEKLFPVPVPFQLVPLGGPIEIEDRATITYFPLTHPGGAVGYRLDCMGRSMAYVSDTIASLDADYIDRIRGVDLLLHEAHFVNEDVEMIERTGHSHVLAAAEVAAAAQVSKLVLVHLSPLLKSDDEIDLAAAREVFPATEIGVDRMELEF